MAAGQKKWYVIRAISGKEKKVKEMVEMEVSRSKMGSHIAQVLIPMEKFYQIRDGKKVSKERNFFPGYVLMEADLTGEIAHTIKNLPNVIGFLGSEKGGDPVPLRQSEVNRILGTVDELADAEATSVNPYHVGEGVKVIDGPFNGFNGVIEEI
jgi:transcriptional antiterminator NusG